MDHTAAIHRRISLSTNKSMGWILHSSSCFEYLVAVRDRKGRKHPLWLQANLLSLTAAKLCNTNRTGYHVRPTTHSKDRADAEDLPIAALPCLSFYSLVDSSSFKLPEPQPTEITWHSANRQSLLLLQERQKNNWRKQRNRECHLQEEDGLIHPYFCFLQGSGRQKTRPSTDTDSRHNHKGMFQKWDEWKNPEVRKNHCSFFQKLHAFLSTLLKNNEQLTTLFKVFAKIYRPSMKIK